MSMYRISSQNNGLIFHFSDFSGRKVNLVGTYLHLLGQNLKLPLVLKSVENIKKI